MLWARSLVVFLVLLLLASTHRASAQSAPNNGWGVLAELAEQDFQVDGLGGASMINAFRWEEPGKQMSLTWQYGLGHDKTIFTLDPHTGDIVALSVYYSKYGDKYAYRLKVGPDGNISDQKGTPYASKSSDGSLRWAGQRLIPLQTDSKASQKAAKLIANGELRPPNPGLRGARTSSGSMAVVTSAKPQAVDSSQSTPHSASTQPAAVVASGSMAFKKTPQGYEKNWGDLATLVGGAWANGSYVTWFEWEKPGKRLVQHNYNADGTANLPFTFESANGKQAWYWLGEFTYKVNIREDGAFFMKDLGKLFARTGPDTYTGWAGKWRKGVFEPSQPALVYYLRRLSPSQIASFNRLVQKRAAEARTAKDNEPSMLGAMVRGLAMGVSGVEAPLMNQDGSEVNTLEVLNAAGAELARQNAAGQAQLDANIARASAPPHTYTQPPASSALQQAPAQPAFEPSKPTATCSYWHRPRAGDREYEQCSPGDENCTCADASKVSNQ